MLSATEWSEASAHNTPFHEQDSVISVSRCFLRQHDSGVGDRGRNLSSLALFIHENLVHPEVRGLPPVGICSHSTVFMTAQPPHPVSPLQMTRCVHSPLPAY